MVKLLILASLITSSLASNDCEEDSDCVNLYECIDSQCKHKEFKNPDPTEIIAIFFIFTASALGNAGGLGGGPIYTSILVLLPQFLIRDALPYTQLLTAAGSFYAVLYELIQRHPHKDRPAIYYEVIGFVISPLIVGTVVGVEIGQTLPE